MSIATLLARLLRSLQRALERVTGPGTAMPVPIRVASRQRRMH